MSENQYNQESRIPPVPENGGGYSHRSQRPEGYPPQQPPYNQYVHDPYGYRGPGYMQPENQSNPYGTTGFILSLVALLGAWVPYAGWLVWLLALIFSAIGVTRKPRGLAVAGLVISIGMVVVLMLLIAIIGIAAFSSMSYLR